MAEVKADKPDSSHIEILDDDSSNLNKTATQQQRENEQVEITGTVKLTDGAIVYVPTPTADPQDPLNMPMWQKYVVILMLSLFSTLGLSLVSGLGGLLGFYIPEYSAQGYGRAEITALMTYPSLFMGISNLFGIPLSIAIGRRVVFLGSTLILVASSILCAFAKTYNWHLGARCFLAIAAGQSEALVPMMTQELFFLHERGKGLMIQNAVQTTLNAVWILCASPIAQAITPGGWYGLGAGLSALQFVLSIFLVPETKYERSLDSFQETNIHNKSTDTSLESGKKSSRAQASVVTTRPALDLVSYAPRTWRSDMRLWVGTPDWTKGFVVFKQCFVVCLFPNVLWAMCLNGLTLGVNIAIGTTYGAIVEAAPYHWAHSVTSYANTGQILVAVAALPLLGFGSDKLITWKAKRNSGIHEPEARLIPLIFPIAVGIFTAVLYGQGAAKPNSYHWFVYIWALGAYYFCFIGANIVGITYTLDSYPTRAGPMLVAICAFRGIIAFGVSYGVVPFTEIAGFDGAFAWFGGLTGLLGLFGIPVYFWGKPIRRVTGRWTQSKHEKIY